MDPPGMVRITSSLRAGIIRPKEIRQMLTVPFPDAQLSTSRATMVRMVVLARVDVEAIVSGARRGERVELSIPCDLLGAHNAVRGRQKETSPKPQGHRDGILS